MRLKSLPSEIVQIVSVYSSSSVTVQLPDSMTGSNIGGIISGVSVTLILIITVSVAVTSLILYFVLRYIMFNLISIALSPSLILLKLDKREKREKRQYRNRIWLILIAISLYVSDVVFYSL